MQTRPRDPTPGGCSSEERVFSQSRAGASGWGPGRGAEARVWGRFPPDRARLQGALGDLRCSGCLPRPGASQTPRIAVWLGPFRALPRVELEEARALPSNRGWGLNAGGVTPT